ncbi:glycosyltransferase family 4 protein [Rhodocytophaga rosea]|uniref:Glycosyltransferase family 4 protein n=1 Tax=Rhodocytophaga rosea TaxID=2704465 RepID=A0A6C0GQK3_9BACT|nr:glycosyltransferase family 4 protein [Rhodocytophaga rosea]QHT70339.1 glycosyltransferase family 4 protein [Rhodocytophaga rosea]
MHNKRIKILHTIRQGSFGGGETYLYNLVTRLDKQVFEPLVLSFTEGAMVDKLRQAGIRTFVIPTLKPFNIFIYRQVLQLLKNEQIDLVHMHGTRAATNTLIPALWNGTKTIYTVHGWSFHTGNKPLITRGRIMAERFITSQTSQVVCGSQADLQQGLQYCPGGKYTLFYNSIDTHYFDPALPVTDLCREFGFTQTDVVITFMARLTAQKDPLTFIKAIPRVKNQFPQAKFLMIGEGELKNECIQLAQILAVSDVLTFSEFRSDVKKILQLTDVFVLPSLWEVIPLGLLEAMSMEKACIATAISGTTEAITDGENGLLIDIQSPDQLADKMIQLLSDELLRRNLGKNARVKVIRQFDIRTLVEKNKELYLQLATP